MGAVALAVVSWGATLFIESPQDAAARAGAPAPSLIAAPVELRKVGEEIVTRGLVEATQTVEAITQVAPEGALRALISGRIPKAGTPVVPGTVVVEISGRPVIALEGSVPAYRNLGPEDSGPDVVQLRSALASAGLRTADSAGEYGESTVRAVARLFEREGYSPPAGGRLPAAEVVFVSSLPASVVASAASLGSDVSAASVKVASGKLAITADLPAGQAALVKPGAQVVVSSEALGQSVKAKVARTGSREAPSGPAPGGGSDQSPDEDEGEVEPNSEPAQGAAKQNDASSISIIPDKNLDSEWAGQDVRVRVVSAETVDKVLAVPVTAIVMNGSGVTEIVLVDDDATTLGDAHPVRIAVEVGVTGGGWVQVEPADGKASEIEPGDLVQLSEATLSESNKSPNRVIPDE